MKLLLISIYLLLSLPSYSQTIIKGTISDAVTDKKLKGVSVYVNDIQKVVSSNANGNFSISGLPDGILQFQFSLLGYKTFDLTIETDKITEPLDIKLIPI